MISVPVAIPVVVLLVAFLGMAFERIAIHPLKVVARILNGFRTRIAIAHLTNCFFDSKVEKDLTGLEDLSDLKSIIILGHLRINWL